MNRVEARDAIYSHLTPELNAAFVAVLGAPGFTRYSGVKDNQDATVPNDVYWSHVSMQIVAEDQETLRNCERRFKSEGLVFVQLFVPTLDKRGQFHLDAIADGVRNIFRTRATGDDVEFTRARIVDNIKPEPNWLRANVVSEFQYRQFL